MFALYLSSRHVVFAFFLALVFLTFSPIHAQNSDSTDTAPGADGKPSTPSAKPPPEPPKPASPPSILSNGDFEMPGAKDPTWPSDWGKDAGITWESDNGKHYLHFVQTQPGKMLMAYRELAIPPGVKGLEVYERYRTSGVKVGTSSWYDVRTIFHFLDAERKQVEPDAPALVLSTDAAAWTEKRERFVVPPNAVTLQMMPTLFQVAAGTLDIAEIRISPISDNEADAMTSAAAAAEKKRIAQAAAVAKDLALPPVTPEIKVSGNKLLKADGSEVWLQGVNVCGLEWAPPGENTLWTIKVAIDTWKANCIRLPVNDSFWFGRGKNQQPGEASQKAYRDLVDNAVKMAAAKGAYIVLDLHRYQAPDEAAVEFWKDAAAHFKDNPAVLFDLYNEPFGTTWEIWRNGGEVEKKVDGVPEKYHGVGMQALVDTVRSTGAKNIIIAGGLDYAYDDSGILKGFALEEKSGNGIMYSVHVYNWKRDWQHKFMDLADKYPLFLGECGADIHKMSFIPSEAQEDPYTWVPNFLGLVQKNHLNWTGWSFHVSATPVLLLNWDYEPTPYWGAFAKDALGGKPFTFEKMR